MRNFNRLDGYLTELAGDIYPQPQDDGHNQKTSEVLMLWLQNLPFAEPRKVLDVGCGQGNSFPIFDGFGWLWTGVTMGEDYSVCKAAGLRVYNADFSFLPFEDEEFNLIFARHALEHSPMPLLTLMEWHRVCKFHLGIVVPSVEKEVVAGRNHYTLLHRIQWEALLFRAGFRVMWVDNRDPAEYRLFCQKVARPPAPANYDWFTTYAIPQEDLRK